MLLCISIEEIPRHLLFLSYFSFIAGVALFSIGLYNETSLELNEKGYYIAVMILVAVGAVLTQKVTRDNAEDNEILAEQQNKSTAAVRVPPIELVTACGSMNLSWI